MDSIGEMLPSKAKVIWAFLAFFSISCNQMKIEYPDTRKDNVTDNYFGTEVADPYRWLEDDNSDETRVWVDAQNKVAFGYLNAIPFRNKVKEQLTTLWNFSRMSAPSYHGGRYFYFRNNGLQDQDVLFMADSVLDNEQPILDPNTLSTDGPVSVSALGVSSTGRYLAYGMSKAGSDWVDIYVKDLVTGEQLSDHLRWVKFSSIAWYGNGFYYARFDEPKEGDPLTSANKFQKVFYHTLGTNQQQDEYVFGNYDAPDRYYDFEVTEDEKYLIVYEREGFFGNTLHVKNLSIAKSSFVSLTKGFDYSYQLVASVGDHLYVLTNYEAPLNKLVKINLDTLQIGAWEEIIPQKGSLLQEVVYSNGRFIAHFLKDASSRLEIYALDGGFLNEIKLPALGSVEQVNGSSKTREAFYEFVSFVYPKTCFKVNMDTYETSTIFKPEVEIDPDKYVTKQVFYTSKDGTSVPMFIVHKKGMKQNRKNPAFLYGYGGFDISLSPLYKPGYHFWLNQGGVLAIANLRGGGEYGKPWHEAGTKEKKQNVFDDFIAAAEYLIDEKYTSKNKLSIHGRSNGGLLVGAVTNQRPDLFAVAVPGVGVMDMLRFHKFTIGSAWIPDYGCADDSAGFDYLYKYSPVHNIKEGRRYPAVMVMTADHDDRVVPAHSFKYAATLQALAKNNKPHIIRIETNAGHGAGKPTSMKIEEEADLWSFIMYNLEMVYH